MKKILFLVAALLVGASAFAQNEYNLRRRSLFNVLPVTSKDIIFLGNSITDGCEWAELFDNRHIKNRGISGDRSVWLLDRIDSIIAGHPKKLFLMIGTNDLIAGTAPRDVVANIGKLIDRFQTESPWTKLFVQSLLPMNGLDPGYENRPNRDKGAEIIETNVLLEKLCLEKTVVYLDIYSSLVDARGQLDKHFTSDGLHLTGDGYLVWKEILKPYVK